MHNLLYRELSMYVFPVVLCHAKAMPGITFQYTLSPIVQVEEFNKLWGNLVMPAARDYLDEFGWS